MIEWTLVILLVFWSWFIEFISTLSWYANPFKTLFDEKKFKICTQSEIKKKKMQSVFSEKQ